MNARYWITGDGGDVLQFKPWKRLAVLCVGCALVCAATGHASQVLYGITQGINSTPEQLITLSASAGTGAAVGTLGTSMNAIGLAQTGGNLYAFDTNNNVLQQIDPTNPANLAAVAVGFTALDTLAEGDLAFNSSGTGYLVSSLRADGSFDGTGSLFTLDLTGHTNSAVADPLAQLFSGLAFNPVDGKLYALTVDGTALYLVNPSNGNLTLQGSTGIAIANAIYGGLSFRSDGTLYASVGNASSDSMLYTLDTTTGASSLLGDTGFQGISGIAFLGAGNGPPPPPGAPEPSTGLLMLAVPLAVAVGRKFHAGRQNHE